MDNDHHVRLHLSINTPRRCLCPTCYRTLTGHAVVYLAGWALCADCMDTVSTHHHRHEVTVHRNLMHGSLRALRSIVHGRNIYCQHGLGHFVPIARPQRPLWDIHDLKPDWLCIQPHERHDVPIAIPPLGLHHAAKRTTDA